MEYLELKSDEIELPSKGYAYDKEGKDSVELINGSFVKVRPFIVADNYALASLKGGDTYSVFRLLLNKVVVEPKNLNFDNLLLSDVLFILFYVRLMSFGADYPVNFKCLMCSQPQFQKIKLNELQVRLADEFEEGYRPDELETQVGKYKLVMHLDRMKDSKLVNQDVNDMKRRGKAENPEAASAFLRWARLIDTIDGQPEIIPKKFEFIMNFTQTEFEELSTFLNDHQTGLIPDMFVNCSKCGYENEARVEIGPEFFRTVK